MAVPSAEAGNDPGERVARVGILLTRGFAFEGCANGFSGWQQGSIDDIGSGARSAISGVDQLHRAGGRGNADQSRLEQPPRLLHLGFFQAHSVAFQCSENFLDPPPQAV